MKNLHGVVKYSRVVVVKRRPGCSTYKRRERRVRVALLPGCTQPPCLRRDIQRPKRLAVSFVQAESVAGKPTSVHSMNEAEDSKLVTQEVKRIVLPVICIVDRHFAVAVVLSSERGEEELVVVRGGQSGGPPPVALGKLSVP